MSLRLLLKSRQTYRPVDPTIPFHITRHPPRCRFGFSVCVFLLTRPRLEHHVKVDFGKLDSKGRPPAYTPPDDAQLIFEVGRASPLHQSCLSLFVLFLFLRLSLSLICHKSPSLRSLVCSNSN